MTATIEDRFCRRLDDPVMLRAIQYGEALRKYPYEKIDMLQFVQLGKVVHEIKKFFKMKEQK